MYVIHGLRIINNVFIDGLIGNLIAFELSEYDNIVPRVEAAFRSSLSTVLAKKVKR